MNILNYLFKFHFFYNISHKRHSQMPGLDINWFRQDKGYNPNILRESLKKRYRDPALVDTIIKMDQDWRKHRYVLDSLKKEWNDNQTAIKIKKKANKEDKCEQQLKIKAQNEQRQKQVELEQAEQLKKINLQIAKVGNIVHESVPVHDNEDFNEVVRTWGKIPDIKITDKRGGLNHHKVLESLGGYDPERGQKIAGHRGYFLRGCGVLLNAALVNFGINFLNKKGYDLVQPPFFMKKEIMQETCQLSDFEENLYKITEGKEQKPGEQSTQSYLIATSEQPISAMHRNEWIEEHQLPIKYGGTSTCFRKEAGAHGKDNWGIFRVHQFEKIEQFVITKPEDSWKAHQEMIAVSEQFYQALNLPYRVINIVSGALNDAAAKKYDLEAWFPGYNAYRELVSTSNCTDFQSRSLNVRCGAKKKDEKQKKYVHMLNGTLCATERTLCCILENYQTEDGLKVPDVLVPYVGTDFLPYKQEVKPAEKPAKKPANNNKKTQKKETTATTQETKPKAEEKPEQKKIMK